MCRHVEARFFLGVIGGYLSFRPGQIKKSRYKPMIVFSGVQFQGEQQITPILGKTVLEIPAGERNAIVYFSALDYDGNRLIRYAYRIKELDSEWSYTGMSHSASLSHIPAGKLHARGEEHQLRRRVDRQRPRA